MTGFAADTVSFFRSLRLRPRNTGAIFPSGPVLSRLIAAQIDPTLDGPIIELGPGTGVFTKALLARGIAPERLILIEFNPLFVRNLKRRFPGVTVIHGSAFDLEKLLSARGITKVAGIVSGLPLLNFPYELRENLIRQCINLLPHSGVMAQFTYSQRPSVQPPAGINLQLAGRVWLNMPPATVWVYKSAISARNAA